MLNVGLSRTIDIKKTIMLIITTKITIIGDINNNDNSKNNYEVLMALVLEFKKPLIKKK